ncbi:hypothetical protein [Fluviicola sp.]|uniref:hypothetical protein n=1 Tax=Fluviicola sp. TaxID=1917219 RepID=UPI00260E8CBC|nr:hypothetical protein [Fluviicola sp.]
MLLLPLLAVSALLCPFLIFLVVFRYGLFLAAATPILLLALCILKKKQLITNTLHPQGETPEIHRFGFYL